MYQTWARADVHQLTHETPVLREVLDETVPWPSVCSTDTGLQRAPAPGDRTVRLLLHGTVLPPPELWAAF